MRRLSLLLFPVRERKKVFTSEKAMELFKWFSLAGMAWGCGCGVLSGQDVVEPLMTNVDLEVQQFRKARAAILKYRVLLELCCEIISLERGTPSGDKSKSMFGLMPEQFETECPPDFRESYIDVLKMVDEYWREESSRKDISVVQNLMTRLEDAGKRFDHQYDLGRSMNALIDWLDRGTMKREGESAPDLLKRLYQWKKDLESGKAVIPEDAGDPSGSSGQWRRGTGEEAPQEAVSEADHERDG